MDHLWSPWRYRFIENTRPDNVCVFCLAPQASRDADNLILHRARHHFVILNLYPYTTGHLMVVPYRHIARLGDSSPDALAEMMELASRAEAVLSGAYRPDGFNIGMNLGKAAGAGIAGHIHLHVLPRWAGDANFVSVVGETRVMPETLADTYEKLRRGWD
jgi:ATP adenylyltransferase